MTEEQNTTQEQAPVSDDAIRGVVNALDHQDDAHWTEAGEPDLNVVSDKLDRRVNREQVDAATESLRRKKRQKKATLSIIMDADVNQNQVKDWLKSCPFSFEGGQTIQWENLE